MPSRIETETDLEQGLAQLLERDPRLQDILAVAGRPELRKRAGGFHGLARIVVSQQLSTASASAIWNRVEAAFAPLQHESVLSARTRKLQRAGLSRPKIRTFRSIGRAVRDKQLDLDALHDMPADAAHAALTAVKGIGPWTADIYLLFCIGHADAWPAGDLALQEAIRLAFRLRRRPDAKRLVKIAEAWRPWRGVAAYLFWSYYRAIKRRDGIFIPRTVQARRAGPVQPKA